MTDARPLAHEGQPKTHKAEDDRQKKARPLNAIGQPKPETTEPVAGYPHPELPMGERQDGPGAGPRYKDRHDAVPAGTTHAARKGGDRGAPEEPEPAHRGQPASFRTGEARGSGAGAGGTRHGVLEEPATDSAGGAGRDRLHRPARRD